MIDINLEELRNKIIDCYNYEPDPEYQKRLEEYHKKIEDDFQEAWSKKKFKWFFKKCRQKKLKAKIYRCSYGPVFWLIEDILEDTLPKQWENSEFFGQFVDVKDIAVGDKNDLVDAISEKCYRDIIKTNGCPTYLLNGEESNAIDTYIEELNHTLTYLNTLPAPVKKIKVKSKFYDKLKKMSPPISSSEVEGIRAKLTGIPIVIDDEIENDYEPVYGEEN